MYSLYRAWFGDSVQGENYSSLEEALSPPDTVVRVGNEGEHQFVAHKGVLAAHSGYLKALLTNATPNASAVNANVASCSNLPATIAVTSTNFSGLSRQPVTSVSVSSIGGEAFAPLLNYMYTGRLEVTLDNVYSVLLATHLLHMPGALEQCRAALLRLRAPLPTPIPVPARPSSTYTSMSSTSTPTGPGNILRPIPNRLMVDPSICWPSTAPIYPATPSSLAVPHLPRLPTSVLMQSSTVPLSVSVVSNVHETQTSTTRYSEAPSYPIDRSHRPRVDFASATSTRTSSRSNSPASSTSPASSQTKRTEPRRTKEDNEDQVTKETETPSDTTVRTVEKRSSTVDSSPDRQDDDRGRPSRRRVRGSSTGNDEILSVVYDIACCDGPVKFHRVFNENYTSAGPVPRPQRPCHESENTCSENDENGGPGTVSIEPTDPASSIYTCGYCKHTFKSQYCYRKHTKRHLLPTRVNDTTETRQRQESSRSKREVRLLDLNVQYYPCKICGCKFPSYYFVHKHRKLCHGNVEERPRAEETAGSNSAEEPEASTTDERQ